MDREIPARERVKNKLKPLPLIILIVFLILIGRLWLNRSLTSASVKASDIQTATVVKGRMEGSFIADAIVTPISTYSIEAMTGGRVEALFLKPGDYVEQGQTILRLSNDDLKLNLLAQEAAVTDQVNNLNNTRVLNNQSRLSQRLKVAEAYNTLKRISRAYQQKSELYNKGYLALEEYLSAQEEHDIAQTRYEYLQEEARTDSLYREQQLIQLEQNVNQLQLSLQQIRNRINELDVKAPMRGQITEMDLKLGQIISTGSSLATIEDDSRYYLQAMVDQYYLSRLSEGATARINYQGNEVMLKVIKVHPRLANDKIRVDIEGELPEGLKSGQSITAEIITDSLADVLYLPQGQYLSDGNGTMVYVLDYEGKRASKRSVNMGFRNIREVEVIQGLSEGEVVITSSYKAFRDKDTIHIKEGK